MKNENIKCMFRAIKVEKLKIKTKKNNNCIAIKKSK